MSTLTLIVIILALIIVWLLLKFVVSASRVAVSVMSFVVVIFVAMLILVETDYRGFVNELDTGNGLYFYSADNKVVAGYQSFPYRSLDLREVNEYNSRPDKKDWMASNIDYIMIFNEQALMDKTFPQEKLLDFDVSTLNAIDMLSDPEVDQVLKTRLFFEMTRGLDSNYFIDEYNARNIDFYPKRPYVMFIDAFGGLSKNLFKFAKGS